MPDLAILAVGCAWLMVAVTGGIALVCLRDPVAGLAHMSHRAAQLPQVMLGRYLAFFGFTLFTALYRNLTVLAVWGATLAFIALADAVIYAREGKPYLKHLSAGGAALIAAAVFFLARNTNGAA